MNSSPARSATTSNTRSLDQRLRMYSIAASAAGMSVATLACPANAEIVYTPAQAKLTTGGQFTIDFNHDGVVDFLILNQARYETGVSCSFCGQSLNVSGNGNVGAGVVGHKAGPRLDAAALPAGAVIGPADAFLNAQSAQALVASGFNDDNSFFNIYGRFANTKNRFVGLKFEINGELHYGWARFIVVTVGIRRSGPYVTAIVNGYAYETVPNQPIAAGATSGPDEVSKDQSDPASVVPPAERAATLGLLAMGSPALSVWRREESSGEARP
jgi:hypothetical protein